MSFCEEKAQEVYVIKYALTDGVYKVRASINEGGRYISLAPEAREFFNRFTFAGYEWRLTREDADAAVSKMIQKKQTSLRKALKKLEDLSKGPVPFTDKTPAP